MSRGINKFIGIGNCCADPEVRYMPNGNAVTNITIACNETWKDKQTGQQQERAEFVRIVFFNRLAEIAGEYLRKGSKIYIEGALRTRKWQAQDGTDRYTTEIVAGELQMLDSQGNGNAGNQRAQQQMDAYQPPAHNTGGAGTAAQHTGPAAPPDFDDDIPFAPYQRGMSV